MIVDTHAHLDMEAFKADLPEVLERASKAGVDRIITIGIDIESSLKAIELAEEYSEVWAAVGVHPHAASLWEIPCRRELESMLDHSKVVAVGEIGLDFYRNYSPHPRQIEVFKEQLCLAEEKGRPVIIHARKASQEVLKIMREKDTIRRGVMHCFSGTEDTARAFVDLGMKISVAGPLTYPAADELHQIIASLPIECLMVETDCPYLAPQSHRGKRNEPSLVTAVVDKIAEIKGLTTDDVARITTVNAGLLFGLGLETRQGKIAYRIRRSLYLNITNRCSNVCTFCGRQTHFRVKGHDLLLDKEPSTKEILEAVDREKEFDEIVFCGYGEPLLRLDTVIEAGRILKNKGYRIRVNTNGLASLTHGCSIPELLADLVDRYSISLNAPDAETYMALCRPSYGRPSFEAIILFIKEAVQHAEEVTVTAVDIPGVDLEACRNLAQSLGAMFRVREYNEIG